MFNADVAEVQPLDGRRLRLRFTDGLEAVLEMDKVLGSYEGVFAPLREANFFNLVRVDPELGTVVWPNGADVCQTCCTRTPRAAPWWWMGSGC